MGDFIVEFNQEKPFVGLILLFLSAFLSSLFAHNGFILGFISQIVSSIVFLVVVAVIATLQGGGGNIRELLGLSGLFAGLSLLLLLLIGFLGFVGTFLGLILGITMTTIYIGAMSSATGVSRFTALFCIILAAIPSGIVSRFIGG